MMVRRAKQLFKHVHDVLRQTKLAHLSTNIVNDYSTVLRTLLAVPAYCAMASPEDMQGLLSDQYRHAQYMILTCSYALINFR